MSSVAILGGATFWTSDVATVADALARCDAAGVNHLDIAPSYGMAEQLVGEVLPDYRDRWFVACKTMARDRDGARAELERSLQLLRTDHLDLYQLHAVTTDAELEAILRPGGAIETLLAAKADGVVRAIGLTGHFQHVPRLFLRAAEQVDLDTVLLPVNPPMLALPGYRAALDDVFALAAERDIGVMAIKVVARSPWPDGQRDGSTWYRPHRDPAAIGAAVRFALSLPVTCFAMPGDVTLLPAVLDAAERFTPMDPEEAEAAIAAAAPADALVAPG